MTERAEETKRAYENGEPVLALDLMNLVNEEHDKEKAEESYLRYRYRNCEITRNAHNHMHKDWRASGIDRHKAYTDGYLEGLKAGRKQSIDAKQNLAEC